MNAAAPGTRKSPLHHAATNRRIAVAIQLSAAGAGPNIFDHRGEKSLEVARRFSAGVYDFSRKDRWRGTKFETRFGTMTGQQLELIISEISRSGRGNELSWDKRCLAQPVTVIQNDA